MDFLYEKILRPLFFRQSAEAAHDNIIKLLRVFDAFPPLVRLFERHNLRPPHTEPVELFGLRFPNRVGLAAGFDKHAQVWTTFGALGFGHVEIGTFTLHKQDGNPKPRVFRHPEYEAVVNSYGFPNPGAEIVARRLAHAPGKETRRYPLGINIGKSKVTPLEQAADDYLGSFRRLADYADFIVINVSSPNTPGLRELQTRSHLVQLLAALQRANKERAVRRADPAPLPVLLKIAPDLTPAQLDEILEIADATGIAGIVATNTTIERPSGLRGLETAGGLSGRPLLEKSLGVVRYLARAAGGKFPIIGCGGICAVEDAGRFMDEGASLVQIYTGMIFRGPFFAAKIARSLAWHQRKWV
ncbi:MAG: quinone-dependent dihydroorotate dehydrogenase [Puniceicoccales bacterium]|jgi:dihydroorotate dehydrogenase|nr:quinone-dependent dihydroorotate dehydrogenase [Puniceicoccales bacterium]